MTKEYIIAKHLALVIDPNEYPKGYHWVSEAMEEYSRQQAIAFVKWVFQKGYIKNPAGDLWYSVAGTTYGKLNHTTEELYNLFLTHQSNQP